MLHLYERDENLKQKRYYLRYLGGFIGDETTMKEFVREKVKNWQAKIQLLSAAANFCPHESFSVFSKSVQTEWKFLMRVVPGCDEILKPLEDSIKKPVHINHN